MIYMNGLTDGCVNPGYHVVTYIVTMPRNVVEHLQFNYNVYPSSIMVDIIIQH